MKLPQFSLRDLFWLVLMVGISFAWWRDRSGLAMRLWREQQPPNVTVRGTLTAFDESKWMVSVALGSKHGLRKGSQGDIWHNGKYLGNVIVANVSLTDSSCNVNFMNPERGPFTAGHQIDFVIPNPALSR